MPMVTNVSRRLIHAPGAIMLVPGVPVELDDDAMDNPHMKRLMDEGAIREGEVEVRPEVDQEGDGTDDTGTKPAAAAPVKTAPAVKPPEVKAATSPAGAAKG